MSSKQHRKSLSTKFLQQRSQEKKDCIIKEAQSDFDVTNHSSNESVDHMQDPQLVVFNTFDKLAQNWRSSIDTSLEELDSSIHDSDFDQDGREISPVSGNPSGEYGKETGQSLQEISNLATDEEKWRKMSQAHIIPVCKGNGRDATSASNQSLTKEVDEPRNNELLLSYPDDSEKEKFAHSLEDSAVDVDYDPEKSICDAINTQIIEINGAQRRYRTQINVSFVSRVNYGHVSSPDLRAESCVGSNLAAVAGNHAFISHSQDSFMVIGKDQLKDMTCRYSSDYSEINRSSVSLNLLTDCEDTESQASDQLTDETTDKYQTDGENCCTSLSTSITTASVTTNQESTKRNIRKRSPVTKIPKCVVSRNGELELEREVKTVELILNKHKEKKELCVSKTQMTVLRKEIQNKNQEIKDLKLQLKFQKEKIRDLTQQIEKGHQHRSSQELASSAQIRQLRNDLKSLRQDRERLRKELASKACEDKFLKASERKNQELERRKRRLSLADGRGEAVKTTKTVQQMNKSLMERNKELEHKQKTIYKLECEKLYLGEEIYRLTGVEEGFWSDEKLPRPTLTPKEQCLVRKNSSLNTEISRLQNHCKSLNLENNSLKRKMELELERPIERKEKEKDKQKELHKLKKKNYELSTITRKLEEKVKSLEKKTKESPTIDRRSLILNKQKERDAEYERQIQDRDKEIQKLKVRMKELVRKLTGQNGEITRAQSTLELEQIIRTVTKERLQLERHLAVASEVRTRHLQSEASTPFHPRHPMGLSRSSDLQTEQATKLAYIRDTNSALRQQLDDLELLTRQHHTLEKHVQEKDLECVSLKEKLKLKNELCQDLESQLAKVIEKNTVLTIQNSDLQKQIQELQHVTVSEECRSLKQTLGRFPRDSQWPPNSGADLGQALRSRSANLDSCIRLDNAYGLPDGLHGKTGDASLEQVLIQMKEASEKRRELQKQHAEALQQLSMKQVALEGVLGTASNKKAASEAIEALKSKIRELEKKAEAQNLRHEELLLEMQSMKKTQGSPKNSWSRSESLSAELQSPESEDITPDSSQILSNCSTPRSTPVPTGLGIVGGPLHRAFDPLGLGTLPDTLLTNPPLSTSPITGHTGNTRLNTLTSGVFTATTTSNFSSTLGASSTFSHNLGTAFEIDRLMAKLKHDNKILAEFDKNRTTFGLTSSSSVASAFNPLSSSAFSDLPYTNLTGHTLGGGLSGGGVSAPLTYSAPHNTTATTVAALDLSQPFCNPLVNSFTNPIGNLLDPTLSHLNLGLHGASTSLAGGSLLHNPNSPSNFLGDLNNLDLGVGGLNLMLPSSATSLGGGTTFQAGSSLPTIITTSFDKDDKNLLNGNLPGVIMATGHLEADNRLLDVLEIPGKGRCHVYIARFSYDPFQQSPNENPEAELALNAGDYVLVWGNMDEVAPPTIDGFFDGELLDGRKGLVPSNFVEKLVGDDLIEFHQSIVMGLRDCEDSVSTSVPQDLDFISQDDSQMLLDYSLNQQGTCSYSSYLDLEDIIEEEDEPMGDHDLFFSVLVPPPVQLTLERQLNKSILIGWNPPPDAPPGTIESYHVYVNGILKTTVKANERTRALVEGVDSTKLHRISVRAVTPHRRTSRDAACTMVIGKDAPICPTSVKATNITSTSAIISWMPSNSNYQHTVCVNSVEVRTVKPGVYRHTITGLSPNTTYRVTIRAKNLIRAPQFDEKHLNQNQVRVSCCVEFRTLPKGLPDPPVDVQVELGPQDGTLLVTWLPVTLNDMGGTSNGAPVTGYAVYADGKKVIEVDSPTGDHALIDLTKIHGFEPKQITVRTKSREAVSADSVPTAVPSQFQRTKGRGKELHQEYKTDHISGHRPGHQVGHQLGHQMVHQPGHQPLQHPTAQQQTAGSQLFAGTRGLKDRLLGRKVPPAPPPQARTDNLGQTILEHEENLSDKEIYPGQPPHPHPSGPPHPHQQHHPPHHPAPIPSIEITKEPPGGEHHLDYPEDEYDSRGRYDPRGPHARPHMDRGRPHPTQMHRPVPPRDPRGDHRDYRDPHGPRDPRDYRDPRDNTYSRDPRDHRDTRDRRDGRDYRDPRDYREMDPRDRYDDRHRSGDYRDRMRSDHPRIFVALFDYDPPTMSPNPEFCDEELGFREGQLIKVYGEKDPDGFYYGEGGGRAGYVPCNMVSEVQVDDDKVAQELFKDDSGRRRREGSLGRRAHAGDRWGDIYANTPVRKMVAIYDYDPQELSPNVDSEVELSFQTGDIIYVYGDMDDDGFYMGELRGQRGLVPSNFLQEAPTDYDEHRSRRDTLDPRDRPHPSHPRGHGPGAHGPPPPPRPDQRDKRKGYESGPNGKPPRTTPRPRGQQQQQPRPGEKW